MEYRILGNTGLKVSELCLGTMTFGGKFFDIAVVGQSDASRMVSRALAAGVNFFDTADIYSRGESESMLGKALREARVSRDAVVIATKVRGPMSEDAAAGTGDVNNTGLSRKHIIASCEASLKRLKTDFIDLYQVHGWDPITPIEESLGALDDLVRQGKARYIGCSNWPARHVMKALCLSRSEGLSRFVSLQAYYSLVGRDLEYELLPLCVEENVGVLPWSPLAGGFLSGKYTRRNPHPKGCRRKSDFNFPPVDEKNGFDAVEALEVVAKKRGVSVPQAALAWLLARPGISSVIIGAKTIAQLEDNLKASQVSLAPGEIEWLSAVTAVKSIYPGWMVSRQNAGK
ncbi:MAG: aldo/keto reductase [Elusimicrobiota bacterium]